MEKHGKSICNSDQFGSDVSFNGPSHNVIVTKVVTKVVVLPDRKFEMTRGAGSRVLDNIMGTVLQKHFSFSSLIIKACSKLKKILFILYLYRKTKISLIFL